MLNLKKVLSAKPKPHEDVKLASLSTPWGLSLNPEHVLEEHPNPQFARKNFQVLNGRWKCGFDTLGNRAYPDLGPAPTSQDCPLDIVVPFSPETKLSGVGRQLQPGQVLRYWRSFSLDCRQEGMRTVLHFEAVDYRCNVWVNGAFLGTHVGGYTAFQWDITDLLEPGENTLALAVEDPTDAQNQLVGKQRLSRGDIWYTAQSGIWQTVWLEQVPKSHLEDLQIKAKGLTGEVQIFAEICGMGKVAVQIKDADEEIVYSFEIEDAVESNFAHICSISNPHLWSPDDPYLYTASVRFGTDEVQTYFAIRTCEVKADDQGVARFFLNGQPYFLKGVLDQGYWPESLMTAPSDEALVFDIQYAKKAGFNLMRKHIKVESQRWYYHCDRLGMLVWQDMVSAGGSDMCVWHTSYQPTLFKASWKSLKDDKPSSWKKLCAESATYRSEWTETMQATIKRLQAHPCIVGWVLFNEGWGQFCAQDALRVARKLDDSRPIDAVSGWYDQSCGDFNSVHNYFRPLEVWPDKTDRAFVISEFGGASFGLEGHTCLPTDYGYATFASAQEWRQQVDATLRAADALQPAGLAGYVYTQLADVEEETNGLLTFDRTPKA